MALGRGKGCRVPRLGRPGSGVFLEWFRLELGPLFYTGWEEADDSRPAIAFMPQLELTVGPRDVFFGVLGVGSPLVTTYRRPGLVYGGLDIVRLQDHRLMLRGGIYRTGPPVFDSSGGRFDAVWRYAVTDSLSLRLAGSLGGGGKRSNDLDREASFGLVTNL